MIYDHVYCLQIPTMLVNHLDSSTMGFLVEKEGSDAGDIVEEYEPAVMWNLKVKG